MTEKQAVANFLGGKACLVVEFRSSKAERIKWRDKVTKATMEAPILRHAIEAADGTPMIVNERVDEKFDETKYVQKFKRGDKVYLAYTSSELNLGVQHFSGSLEPLTA